MNKPYKDLWNIYDFILLISLSAQVAIIWKPVN